MKTLVLGMGRQGRRRAEALAEIPGQTVICHDSDATRLENLPAGLSACQESDLDGAIEAANAIAVCTPSCTHVGVAIPLLHRRKNLLIEKPLAFNTQDAWSLVSNAVDNGVKIHVGLNMRYRDPVLAAQKSLKELGPIDLITGHISHSQFLFHEDCRFQTSGGPLRDIGTHVLDLCLLFAGVGCDSPRLVIVNRSRTDWHGSLTAIHGETRIEVTASFRVPQPGVSTTIHCHGADGTLQIKMSAEEDSVTLVRRNVAGIRNDQFQFPDDCWKLDCEKFIEMCAGGESNMRHAALLASLLDC